MAIAAYAEYQEMVKKVSTSKKCQSVYRESESQTDPWLPLCEYRATEQGLIPEILTLPQFNWGKRLPFDRNDVLYLERIRKRKLWEQYFIEGNFPKEVVQKVFIQLDIDDYKFLDKECDAIIEKRVELANEELKDQKEILAEKLNERILFVQAKNKDILDAKRETLAKYLNKEIRLLNRRDRGVTQFGKGDLLERYLNKSSDIYVLPERYGRDYKLQHEHLSINFEDNFELFCKLDTNDILVKPEKTRTYVRHVCKTFWPSYNYKKTGTKEIPEETAEEHEETIPSIPLIDFEKDKLFRSVVYIQRLIRGRACQFMMHINKLKNLDTIKMIMKTYGIAEESISQAEHDRLSQLKVLRKYSIISKIIAMIIGIINQAQGAVLSTVLDFAYKELERLEDERTSYKLVQNVHLARWSRESREAGQRQKELRRRRQHQEMTRQVTKAHELCVDEFMLNLMDEALREEAELNAKESVAMKADEMEPRFVEEDLEAMDREMFIARLLFSHLIPESERLPVREQVEAKQADYRREAYKAIFGCDEIEPEDETASDKKMRLLRIKQEKENEELVEANRDVPPNLGMNQEDVNVFLKEFLLEAAERMKFIQSDKEIDRNVSISTLSSPTLLSSYSDISKQSVQKVKKCTDEEDSSVLLEIKEEKQEMESSSSCSSDSKKLGLISTTSSLIKPHRVSSTEMEESSDHLWTDSDSEESQ